MKAIRAFVGLAVMCALGGALSSSARAQIGLWGTWAPWYAYPFAPYTTSYRSIPSPPYFAVHPPVYYGPRIRMAYGHSPIARPPLTVVDVGEQEETPQWPRPAGLTIFNPYVADAAAESDRGTTVVQPQAVENPHYSKKKRKSARR